MWCACGRVVCVIVCAWVRGDARWCACGLDGRGAHALEKEQREKEGTEKQAEVTIAVEVEACS